MQVRYYGETGVRITHTEASDAAWVADVFVGLPPEQTQGNVRVETVNGCAVVRGADGAVLFSEAQAPCLNAKGGFRLAFQTRQEERFFGWGEWFNAYARRSGQWNLEARESPAFLQGRQTYSTIPMFISSRGYACFLLNSRPSRWKLDDRKGILSVEVGQGPADYLLIFGRTLKEIVRQYTQWTGRPPLLPHWAFGLWVTAYPQEGQDKVVELVREHRRRDVALDGVILDYHWEENFHNFQFRKSLFPRPERLVEDLRQENVRLGLIFTPFLNTKNEPLKKAILNLAVRNVPAGLEKDDERDLEGYQQAQDAGFLAHPDAAWWFGRGGMFDFTNPTGARWWCGRMEPLYRLGVAFFKNDDGEYLPKDARSASGLTGEEYHNLYGFYYGKAIYEGMEGLDDRRGMVYARSVWAGSQRYPALFLGDQKPTFAHLRATLRAALNLSWLGFSYWTADVFGLDGRTTPETHMRYAQWTLLSPVARYFQRPAAVDDTRSPWSHSPQAAASFQRYAELRYRLLPYYHCLGWEAYMDGTPVMRPLALEFEGEPELLEIADQVMLGPAVMAAPVVEGGAATRAVIFPPGKWFNFWTDEAMPGGERVEVRAAVDELPLFVRGGQWLVMGPAHRFIGDGHRFDTLEFHLWPPFEAELTFRDDDGLTRAYQRGEFTETKVTAQTRDGQVHLAISPDVGTYRGMPETRQMTFLLHFPAGSTPQVVAELEGFAVQAEGNCLRAAGAVRTRAGAEITLTLK